MKNDTEFKKLCKHLKSEDNSNRNEIETAKEQLMIFIKSKEENWLRIYAEAKDEDPFIYSTKMLSLSAILFSLASLLLSFLQKEFSKGNTFLNYFIILIMVCITCYLFSIILYIRLRQKWRKYVLVVLEECKEELISGPSNEQQTSYAVKKQQIIKDMELLSVKYKLKSDIEKQ